MNCENSNSESGITKNKQNSPLSTNASVNDMNMCSCGCRLELGSLKFMRLHVESEEEMNDRLESEQRLAKQEAMVECYAEMSEPHPSICGCVEYNGSDAGYLHVYGWREVNPWVEEEEI